MWTITLLLAAQSLAQAPPLPMWMSGCWEQQAGDRSTIECWSVRDSTTMEGHSVGSRGGKVVEREKMRITKTETDDPAVPWLTFRATPQGAAATEFHWMPSDGQGLTFLNAAHDYPQRIRYWREGKFLMAEIANADGSEARRWRYSPRGR